MRLLPSTYSRLNSLKKQVVVPRCSVQNSDYKKEVMPVADKCGVRMALYPDDPPVSPLRGIVR
jgi:D-mannonate dehydratase